MVGNQPSWAAYTGQVQSQYQAARSSPRVEGALHVRLHGRSGRAPPLAATIAFMRKPITPEALGRKVREVLDAAAATSS